MAARKTDGAGKPLSDTTCPASGQERSWSKLAWTCSGEDVVCPDCGYVGDICWVRGNDLFPRAKTRAHKVPLGFTSTPYGQLRGGGMKYGERPGDSG